ncbi:P-loop containing nucleoside triphosphate hydrolase protein [Mycena leptocephala]|nr:P-loop containing nucleoside triphosphate hydrolase protein [Mycena leptocephala]
MLPSKPKIFHGRESELKSIIEALNQDSPRVAIFGGGGMGKTSLARAAPHHPDISSRFEHRFFVSSESATNSVELAALIGLHDPGKDLTTTVVQYLSQKPPCLLILDNLETPWEPIHTRGGVEEFLSLLTDIPDLALMITMRGSERPAKVAWTHPFLPPLQPLSDDAARQTFMDITDGSADEDMKQIHLFTDNMPLAVELISHLVYYEGYSNVLARWDTEKTSLLSTGYDRKSNLGASIQLSLSSPRIISGAKELLSLLSILPDGLSDVELLQSNLPVQAIRSCKATLISTSLAYIDNKKRLRSLMPIREHIQRFWPPSQFLMDRLRKHFHSLLDLYKIYNGAKLSGIVGQITFNLGNLHQVLCQELQVDNPDVANSIHCVINLNCFHRVTGRGGTTLMQQIPAVLSQLGDHKLDVQFIAEFLVSDTERDAESRTLDLTRHLSL